MRKIVRLLILPLVAVTASCTEVADKDTVTMTVASTQADCVGVSPQKCLLVKEDTETSWSFFYSSIEGFEYEPGYEYVLKVKKTEEDLENLPADKSSITYTLVEVTSKIEKQSEGLPEIGIKKEEEILSWTGRILELTEEAIGRGAAEGEEVVTIAKVWVTSGSADLNFKEGDTIYSEFAKELPIVPEKDREYAFKAKSFHPAHAKGVYSLETIVMDLIY